MVVSEELRIKSQTLSRDRTNQTNNNNNNNNATVGPHLHVLLLHGLVVGRVLRQVAVGGTQVVDVAGAGHHAGGVLHQVGLLAGRQRRRVEAQQLGDVLL